MFPACGVPADGVLVDAINANAETDGNLILFVRQIRMQILNFVGTNSIVILMQQYSPENSGAIRLGIAVTVLAGPRIN